MTKKLYKSKTDSKLSGVCGGLAQYFSVDSTMIRIVWLISVLILGTGVFAYIICAIVMPEDPGCIETKYTEKNADDFHN